MKHSDTRKRNRAWFVFEGLGLICLIVLWLGLFAVFAGSSAVIYAYFRHYSSKPWDLKIRKDIRPEISVLIPAHNEEQSITKKLENLKATSYPKDKMEIIVVDDDSNDSTVSKARRFIEENPCLNVRIQEVKPRSGKAKALNNVLGAVNGDVVIVSDADSFWPNDMLDKALPYLADPTIGAVSGVQILSNPDESSVTRSEHDYLRLSSLLRVAESKIYSTIRFEGGASFYRRKAFEKFDDESGADDSGTALEIVQHNYRTIVVPEAVFYSPFEAHLAGRLKVKTRRATHLLSLWVKCFKLLVKKQLAMPKRIAVPGIFLFIINPIVFSALVIITVLTILFDPISLFSEAFIVLILGLTVLARRLFLEVTVDNLILTYALCAFVLGKRYTSWEKANT